MILRHGFLVQEAIVSRDETAPYQLVMSGNGGLKQRMSLHEEHLGFLGLPLAIGSLVDRYLTLTFESDDSARGYVGAPFVCKLLELNRIESTLFLETIPRQKHTTLLRMLKLGRPLPPGMVVPPLCNSCFDFSIYLSEQEFNECAALTTEHYFVLTSVEISGGVDVRFYS